MNKYRNIGTCDVNATDDTGKRLIIKPGEVVEIEKEIMSSQLEKLVYEIKVKQIPNKKKNNKGDD